MMRRKELIMSGCSQTSERGISHYSAPVSSSRLKYLWFQIRHPFDYTTLCTCPSRKECLQELQGNVFEKDIFENIRLLSSVRVSSQVFVRNGSIERYKVGQYSFTNFMAALSESENSWCLWRWCHEECRRVKKQINRVLHYVTRDYGIDIKVSHRIIIKKLLKWYNKTIRDNKTGNYGNKNEKKIQVPHSMYPFDITCNLRTVGQFLLFMEMWKCER